MPLATGYRSGYRERSPRKVAAVGEWILHMGNWRFAMTASKNDKVAAATSAAMIDVPQELLARYDKLAETTGRSREFLMNEALEQSIDKLEYEFGLLKTVEDYRAGKLETYSLDEVREALGLD